MTIDDMFAGMGPTLISHPADRTCSATGAFATIGKRTGDGNSERRRVTLGFRHSGNGGAFKNVRIGGAEPGDEIAFDVVGEWEAEDLGAVLQELGRALCSSRPQRHRS